jgi:ribosomal protein S18 acetylase RimI-like enzyme
VCDSLKNNELLPIHIRKLATSDINDMMRLEEKCFPEKFRFNESILSSLVIRAEKNTSFAAVLSGRFVGFILGRLANENIRFAEILTIQVEPSLHRKYIGRRLLRYFETQLKRSYEVNSIVLQVYYRNKGAICFYGANGFLTKNKIRNYYGRGDHAFVMQKNFD